MNTTAVLELSRALELPHAQRRARFAAGRRPAFLVGSLAIHVALVVAGSIWLGESRDSHAASRRFALNVVPLDEPQEVLPELALEPERELSSESVAEPRLVEAELPPEPEPVAEAEGRPALVATPLDYRWPSSSRPLAAARPSPGRASVVGAAPAPETGGAESAPAGDAASPPGVFVGAQPDRARSPTPAYPRLARLRNWQGTVVLEVEVDVGGVPLSAQVHTSSGHGILDSAAREAVLGWRFVPATRGGVPEASRVLVPIVWQLVR